MRKQTIRMAVLTCTLTLSLIPMNAVAAPSAAGQITEIGAGDIRPDMAETDGMEGTANSAARAAETEETQGADTTEDEADKPSYTAPENDRHVNVSFSFMGSTTSASFSKLTYPLSLGLKEVDTGDKVTLTVKSDGQILEIEKGDYAITFLKDSGKVPLSVAGDTLHIYENTEYPVRFAANNALKMFTDFLADNIFLACFFVFAALFYKKAIIPRFASDARR